MHDFFKIIIKTHIVIHLLFPEHSGVSRGTKDTKAVYGSEQSGHFNDLSLVCLNTCSYCRYARSCLSLHKASFSTENEKVF